MKSKGRRVHGFHTLLISLILAALALAACAPGGAPSPSKPAGGTSAAPAAKEPYKLGAVFPISGPASFFGNAHRDAAMLAAEEINAAGGINGRPLSLTVYDGESDTTKSVLATRRLIDQDKVLAMLGPSATGDILAAADTITRAGIAAITPGAGSDVIDPVKPWIFSISQHDRFNVAKALDFLHKKLNVNKAGLLVESSSFGAQARKELEAQVANNGITIVATETFGDKDVDATPQLTSIRSRQPDALIVWGSSPTCAIIAKNANQLGIKLPMLQGGAIASQSFIDTAGAGAEGQYVMTSKLVLVTQLPDSDPVKAKIQHFLSAFNAKYQRAGDVLGGNLYDATYVMADALKRAQPDPKSVRDAIEQTKDFVGVNGLLSFSAQRHYGVGPEGFAVAIIKGGKFVPAE